MTAIDKSALKKAYKETPQPMGVFRVGFAGAERVFIGFGQNLPAAFNRCQTELKLGSHRNRELQDLYGRLGQAALQFQVLDELEPAEAGSADPREELKLLARMWARKLEAAGESVTRL